MSAKILIRCVKDYVQGLKVRSVGFWGPLLLTRKGLPEMVVVMVDGGFASVLLKYAMGMWFQKKWSLPVKYDLSWFKTCSMDMDGVCSRTFQFKEVFPCVPFTEASEEETSVYRRWFRYKNRVLFKYAERDFLFPRPLYLDGYYASWRYLVPVRDDLVRTLRWNDIKLNAPNLLKREEIRSKEVSVALHIRRGDFVKLGLCFITAEYYLSAIEYIRKQASGRPLNLFIFSNGFDWVRSELIPHLSDAYELVDINDNDSGYFDLYLMSQCHHQVISNSWLSFFAAFFNEYEKRVVIVPDRMNLKDTQSDDAYGMPGWVRLSSETGDFVGIHGRKENE